MTDNSGKTAGDGTLGETETGKPFVLHLGKVRKKHIKLLKKGQGRLMDEVNSAVEHIRNHSTLGSKKELVPIVVIYRQKDKKKGWLFS